MVMAMSAIANKGVLMRPSLVDRLLDEDGKVVAKYGPHPVRRVIAEDADKKIIEALKSVISTDGTAEKAALDHYTVAGKTGTAQESDGYHYIDNKYFSSFIGFFPADNPEICIYVALDDPKGTHYGGQVAAPVFKQIAEKAANYLNIRPDKIDDPLSAPKVRASAETIPPEKAIVARAQ
jgi:cell division protein FtsI/penicillin-binding protein 2